MRFSEIQIPCEEFRLENGLTLLVHEDHKTPIVAVNIWYHVGSKNEKPGKTGFAHLFEHLMFGGSEHLPGSYIEALERVGATDLNGTTTARITFKMFRRRLSITRSLLSLIAWDTSLTRSASRCWTCSVRW